MLAAMDARIKNATPQKCKTQQPKNAKLWCNIGKKVCDMDYLPRIVDEELRYICSEQIYAMVFFVLSWQIRFLLSDWPGEIAVRV